MAMTGAAASVAQLARGSAALRVGTSPSLRLRRVRAAHSTVFLSASPAWKSSRQSGDTSVRAFSAQPARCLSSSSKSKRSSSQASREARHALHAQYFFSRRPGTAISLTSPTAAEAIRNASTLPGNTPESIGRPATIRRLVARGLAWIGGSIVFIGIGVVAFFIYDYNTYKEGAEHEDISVPTLALNPRRGGPKNLPLYEVQIDDTDCDERLRTKDKPKLVILGGGWGSVAMLKELNPDDYHVTVISPTNYFLFTPMLPSATVGTLELKSLVEPIRRIIKRVNGHFMRARAEDVDFSYKVVEVAQTDHKGKETRFYVPYDKLVIGVGSVTNPHGVKGLENCYFLKDIDDARKIRNKVVQNLEIACLPTTPDDERRRLLSFVVSGGGPTGVEFAAELYDMLNEDLSKHYPRLLRNEISVHLVQSRSHILNTYDETVSKYAEARFLRDQIDVLTNSRVNEVKTDRIVFTQKSEDGTLVTKELPMGLCLWSTGVSQPEFCHRIAQKLGDLQTNRHALETDTHLRLNGAPLGDVYAIGDCSTVQNNVADHIITFVRSLAWKHGKDPETLEIHFSDWRRVAADVKKKFPQAVAHLKRLDRLFEEFDKDHSGTLDFGELRELLKQIDSKLTSLPATAQRAHQQGQYLARKFNKMARAAPGMHANEVIDGDLDAAVYKAFEYHHLGSLAYIGNSAVFERGSYNVSGGLWAVYAWRSVYFAQSVSMRIRILLMMDWFKRGIFGRDLRAQLPTKLEVDGALLGPPAHQHGYIFGRLGASAQRLILTYYKSVPADLRKPKHLIRCPDGLFSDANDAARARKQLGHTFQGKDESIAMLLTRFEDILTRCQFEVGRVEGLPNLELASGQDVFKPSREQENKLVFALQSVAQLLAGARGVVGVEKKPSAGRKRKTGHAFDTMDMSSSKIIKCIADKPKQKYAECLQAYKPKRRTVHDN